MNCVGDYVLRECYVTYVQVMLMRLVTHRNASPSFSTGGVEFRGVQAPPATPEPAAFKIKGNDVRVSLGGLNYLVLTRSHFFLIGKPD